jgi:four helix bundle protein
MVRDFRDLICWQLSWALKDEVLELTARGPAASDFKFRDQIRDSSASASRNISEGFGLFRPAQFARFLGYARASLIETQNHLLDAHQRRYLDDARFRRLFNLARAAKELTTKLMLSKQREAVRERRARSRTRNHRAKR